MNKNLKKFMEEVTKEEKLRNRVIQINKDYEDKDDNIRELITFAKEIGINLNVEDFEPEDVEELSEEELDSVVGGKMVDYGLSWKHAYSSDCFCAVGGGGTADSMQKTCACVVGGAGEMTAYGKRECNANEAVLVCFLCGTAPTFYPQG